MWALPMSRDRPPIVEKSKWEVLVLKLCNNTPLLGPLLSGWHSFRRRIASFNVDFQENAIFLPCQDRVPKGGSLEPWSPEISAVEFGALSFYWLEPWSLILFWLWSQEPKDILREARSAAFSSLIIRVPRLHWFLITAFLCLFVRVNGHKETESEERTVHNTSIRGYLSL